MSDKDVNLIIRAKNEASKAVDAVSKSIEDFRKGIDEASDSSESAKGLLGTLGSEFKKLNREISNLTSLAKAASQIEKVESAIARLEKTAQSSSEDFKKYGDELAKAAERTSKLEASIVATEAAFAREKAATSKARQERAEANKELKRAEAAYESFMGKISKASSSPAAKSFKVFETAELDKAKVKATEAAAAFDRQRESQDRVSTALSGLKKELRGAVNEQQAFRDAVARSEDSVKRANAEVGKAKVTLASMKDEASKAASSIGQTSVAQDKLKASAEKLASDLKLVEEELRALQKYSTGFGGFTDPKTAAALQKQKAEVERARREYELLDARVKTLKATTDTATTSTAAHAKAVRDSAAAAAQAKLEYERQLGVLRQIPGAVASGRGLRGLFEPIYGESRKAMSALQRVRGEILSITTAYLGLYGTIQNIGGVIAAYQSLEAAQNRLGAVFSQNEEAVAKELTFLERQAQRLGVSFQVLADQYGKLSVAANASGFSMEATRKIFLSLAEAGRVNKLSAEQMGRAFLAFEQIISKGKFSAEEVRRQLGDVLPGAFNILATSLGVSAAELDKLMSNGELFATESNLLKFADGLNKRFGDQLSKSLTTVTTSLGRFQNELYQAQIRVAKGGFIDALNEALIELNEWFNSREGRDFFLSLGSALGSFVRVLAQVPQYFGLIANGVKILIALKLSAWFASIVKSLMAARVSTVQVQGAFEAAGAKATSMGVKFTTAAGNMQSLRTSAVSLYGSLMSSASALTWAGVRASALSGGLAALRGAMAATATAARALWLSIGGWVGIAAMGITYLAGELIGGWVGGVDDATSAMDEHQRIMSSVITAYEELGKKTDDWAKSIKDVTLDQVNASVRKLREEYKKAVSEVTGQVPANLAQPLFAISRDAQFKPLLKLRDDLAAMRVSAKEYIAAVEEMYKATDNDDFRKVAEWLLENARASAVAEKALSEAALAAKEMGSELGGLDADIARTGVTMEKLVEPTETVSDTFKEATNSVENFQKGLKSLMEFIPELRDELARLKDEAKIDEIVSGMGIPRTVAELREALDMIGRARAGVAEKYTNFEAEFTARRGTPRGQIDEELVRETARLAAQLGVSAKDLLTVFSYETGGTLDPDKMGPTTKWGRHQGLIQFGEPQAARFGYVPGQSIAEQMEAVGKYLTDAGVKAGDGLLRIYAAVNAGDPNKINASDEAAGGAPGTVLDKVTKQMDGHAKRAGALLDAYSGTAKEAEELFRAEEKLTAEKEKQNLATLKNISDREFQIAQQALLESGQNRAAAIEEAIRRAREENKEITEEQLDRIAELTGRLYDMQHRLDGVKAAEAEVNRLLALRKEIMEQIQYYSSVGDVGKTEQLKGMLGEVNRALDEAADKAIAMWQAIGGPDAELAIARLQNAKLQVVEVGNKAFVTGEQLNKMIADRMTSALDRFAQAVANGENALEALGRAFLEFAAEFLIEIGKMIVQQAILNALQGSGGPGGGVGGFLAGVLTGMFHEGTESASMVGATRIANPAWFNNARRYHGGGIAGLAPGEIPAILREGEVVDPGDGSIFAKTFGAAQKPSVKIVNAFDAATVTSEGLSTSAGEEALLNVVRGNASAFRSALGVS